MSGTEEGSGSESKAPTRGQVRDKIKDIGLENTGEGEGNTEIYEGPQEDIDNLIEDLTDGLNKENKKEGVDLYTDKEGGKINVRDKSNSTEKLGSHKTIDSFNSNGKPKGEFKLKPKK